MWDVSRYERIVIDRFHFRGLGGDEAWCALEILRAVDGRRVVIATEVHDNPGTSIMTACEFLAQAVCEHFSIDPVELVWIEHYGSPTPDPKCRPATYNRVVFKVRLAAEVIFAEPSWMPMRKQDWSSLGLELRQPEA